MPTKHVAHDPYEKPARYGHENRQQGILEKLKNEMLTQAQKTRWLKTGAIIFIFLVAVYYIAPSGVDVYRGCKHAAWLLGELTFVC